MNKKHLDLLIKNLPKYPGIHCRERLFNSAVMITLIMIDGEYNFLFEKRAIGIRQAGEVCFPGGRFDSSNDSSCMDAAIRETVEELGIPEEKINVIGRLNTIVAAMGVVVEPFIGILEDIDTEDIKIQEKEVEKFFCIPISWFIKNNPDAYNVVHEIKPYSIDKEGKKKILLPVQELGLPEHYSEPWGNFKHRVLVYRTGTDIVWGLTAEMVNEFINIYRKTL